MDKIIKIFLKQSSLNQLLILFGITFVSYFIIFFINLTIITARHNRLLRHQNRLARSFDKTGSDYIDYPVLIKCSKLNNCSKIQFSLYEGNNLYYDANNDKCLLFLCGNQLIALTHYSNYSSQFYERLKTITTRYNALVKKKYNVDLNLIVFSRPGEKVARQSSSEYYLARRTQELFAKLTKISMKSSSVKSNDIVDLMYYKLLNYSYLLEEEDTMQPRINDKALNYINKDGQKVSEPTFKVKNNFYIFHVMHGKKVEGK